MVGVINPNSTQTLASQILEAARADYQIAPGEDVPKEDSSATADSGQHSAQFSKCALAGTVIGCIVFLFILTMMLWYLIRRNTHDITHRGTRVHPSASNGNTSQVPWWWRLADSRRNHPYAFLA